MGLSLQFHALGILFCALVWYQAFANEILFSGGTDNRRVLHGASSTSSGYTQLATSIASANKNARKTTIVVTLTTDVLLTRQLPLLSPGASLSVKGACKNAKGKPRRCIIDGGGKLSIFQASLNDVCSLSFENLILQFAGGNGAFYGLCSIRARNTTFQNNYSKIGAAAININTNAQAMTDPIVLGGCDFVNNTAAAGDGGAIAILPSGPAISISHCTFESNAALMGSGGAVAAAGVSLRITASAFLFNVAYGNGGAVYSTAVFSILVSSSNFTGNRARSGKGGAIGWACPNCGGTIEALFCKSTFNKNTAPNNKQTANILFDARSIYNNAGINFCQGKAPPAVRYVMPKRAGAQLTVGTNCTDGEVGCTGCLSNCNAPVGGTCTGDAYLQPQCLCKNKFDPAYGCTRCLAGYGLTSSCTACGGGFLKNSTRGCRFCKGFNEIPGINHRVGEFGVHNPTIVDASFVNSFQECQRKCNATKTASPRVYYCNQWTYFDQKSEAGCAKGCILAIAFNICDVSPVQYNATYGVYYQDLEYTTPCLR